MIIKKYNEILRNLESHLFNLKDLDYIKKQITELTMVYINEVDKNNKQIKNIEARLLEIEEKMELFEEEDGSFENTESGERIDCPYCKYSFLVKYDINNKETICPNCDNLIVLDWGEFEDDM